MTSPFYVHVTPFLQPHAPLNVSHTNVLSLSFSLSLGLVLVWLHLRLHLYCELSRHSKLYPLTGRSAAATATATAIAAFLRRKWKSRLIRLQKFNILCIKLYGRHSLSLSLTRFSCVWRKEAAWMHKIFLVVCFWAPFWSCLEKWRWVENGAKSGWCIACRSGHCVMHFLVKLPD